MLLTSELILCISFAPAERFEGALSINVLVGISFVFVIKMVIIFTLRSFFKDSAIAEGQPDVGSPSDTMMRYLLWL